MAKPAARILFLQGVLGLSALVIAARSFQVQILQRKIWTHKFEVRRESDQVIRPRRGRILDRFGNPLAITSEKYRVGFAPTELRDPDGMRARLPAMLNLPVPTVDAAFRNPKYAYFWGPFSAENVEPLRNLRGVHFDVLYNRVYPMQGMATPLLGHLNDSGTVATDGIERALDSLLRGQSGMEHYAKDARGTLLQLPGATLVEPVAGDDVYLTLDSELQGIAEGALQRKIVESGAHGGDVVVLDVHTGDVLALASFYVDEAGKLRGSASGLLEPNEPGSTAKIFTAAAMLMYGADTTPVPGYSGHFNMDVGAAKPRSISDEHKLTGMVSLADAIKFSSNIAMSQFSMRLTDAQQYTTLRNFGFGSPTGSGFPVEAAGKLMRPALWPNPRYSRPSLAMGYEFEATALQLADGYGAIANHGFLMAPALVSQVRDENGRIVWQHRPDTLRRPIPDSVAAHLLNYLRRATDSGGTGEKAQLDRYPLYGKTGTARIDAKKGGGYRASFASVFPGDAPQVIVYMMINRPKGDIFGGLVTAPVVKSLLQQWLATVHSPIDRSRTTATVAAAPIVADPAGEPVRVETVSLPAKLRDPPASMGAVPDVAGMSARQAIFALERAGFAVKLTGHSRARATVPAAGDTLARGSIVTVRTDSL